MATQWVHSEARDGSGCSWCGSWSQVDANNECRECFHPEPEEEPAPMFEVVGSFTLDVPTGLVDRALSWD